MKGKQTREADKNKAIVVIDYCWEDIFLKLAGLIILLTLCFFILLKIVDFKIALLIVITAFPFTFYKLLSKLDKLYCYTHHIRVQNFLKREKYETVDWNDLYIYTFTPPAATLFTQQIQLRKIQDNRVVFEFSKYKNLKQLKTINQLKNKSQTPTNLIP